MSKKTLDKRRSRVAEEVAAKILVDCEKEKVSQKDVMALVIKHLQLQDQITVKPNSHDAKMTSFETREKVWQFYHENAQESTITTSLARIRLTGKPRIQDGLEFKSSVRTWKNQRGRQYYQNIWMTVLKTFRELHGLYNSMNPLNCVSLGTFYALKPFYVRHASAKDLVMCCCKLHLHTRWAIVALIKCLEKQEIPLPASSYDEFFEHLYADCGEGDKTYLPWNCTPAKDVVCSHISNLWTSLQSIILKSNPQVLVQFTHYMKQLCYDKHGQPVRDNNGEEVKRLKPVQEHVNAKYLLDFIDTILPSAVHHRNHLRYYRNVIHTFKQLFPSVLVDIDFSENLTLEVKFEPQEQHWYKVQVSVHSGILKIKVTDESRKSYHPYISDSTLHDQPFVKLVLQHMLAQAAEFMDEDTIILIESDNCSYQYKSTEHFDDCQEISNIYQRPVVRVYGIAGHGKGEVDHVGGVVKVVNLGKHFFADKPLDLIVLIHPKR